MGRPFGLTPGEVKTAIHDVVRGLEHGVPLQTKKPINMKSNLTSPACSISFLPKKVGDGVWAMRMFISSIKREIEKG